MSNWKDPQQPIGFNFSLHLKREVNGKKKPYTLSIDRQTKVSLQEKLSLIVAAVFCRVCMSVKLYPCRKSSGSLNFHRSPHCLLVWILMLLWLGKQICRLCFENCQAECDALHHALFATYSLLETPQINRVGLTRYSNRN